jgi:hypothetical protein
VITGSEFVSTVSAIEEAVIARGVDEQGLAGLDRCEDGVRDPLLLVHLELETVVEGVLVGGEVGQHRPAVCAACLTVAREGSQVAPRGHRRDRELLLQSRHADGVLRPQHLQDQPAPFLGDERGGFGAQAVTVAQSRPSIGAKCSRRAAAPRRAVTVAACRERRSAPVAAPRRSATAIRSDVPPLRNRAM